MIRHGVLRAASSGPRESTARQSVQMAAASSMKTPTVKDAACTVSVFSASGRALSSSKWLT